MKSEYNHRPVRILVVDDQETNLKVVGEILGQFGFDIVLAGDGEQALRRLERQAVDLVLLDVLMPGHDGFEVCRMIRAQSRWADIPVIFLSAADDKDLIVRALEVGGVDYVTKPFNRAELMSRVRTHLALKAARDHLRQLAEDKDELLGILAHDLKNHLGGMQMSVQLLRDRAATHGDERLDRITANVLHSTEQMFAFVREFLANSAAERDTPLSLQPIALNPALATAIQQYSETARRKSMTLQHDAGPDLAVLADREALAQIIDNLLSNAIKFSPPGKTVRVGVAANGAGGALLRVQDEGPGFSEEDKSRMFRRYCRLSARPTAGEPSTGLGLSIVSKLVYAMGGEIRCQSAPDQGATFLVSLPGASARTS
jgi:two-component system, sensor histidine kinase and response regulator